jgi:hypothetical protein
MYGGRIRTTLALQYEDEIRDLKVTFDLIDRVRSKVPWEKLAIDLSKDEPEPNFSMLAKFIYYNLEAAGFKPEIDVIYDEIMEGVENQAGFIAVASQIIIAYQPQGRVKKKPEKAITKATKPT